MAASGGYWLFHNYAPSLSGSGFFSLVSVCFKLVGSNAVMPCKTCCWLFSTATSIIQMDIIGKKIQNNLRLSQATYPGRRATQSSPQWWHSSVSPYWNPPIGSSGSRPPWANPWVLVLLGLPSASVERQRENEIKNQFHINFKTKTEEKKNYPLHLPITTQSE